VEKSPHNPGAPPQRQTRTYEAAPHGVKTTIRTVTADGESTVEYMANYDSIEYHVAGSATANGIALTKVITHRNLLANTAGWPQPNSAVQFVTDGIESAVNQAKAAAAGKSVAVHGADTIQPLLNAGLLTKSTSTSRRFFLAPEFDSSITSTARRPVLGNPTVIPGVGVTHLRYVVRKCCHTGF
jgi:hypothetical protein